MGCLTVKASGTVASFINPTVTDIESARVYFSPIQLGSGTPSPDNVREIVGRTSVELYHQDSINLIPKTLPSDAFKGSFATGNTTISSATNTVCFVRYVGKNTDIYWSRNANETTICMAFADVYFTSRTDAVIYSAINLTNRASTKYNSGDHPYLVICITNTSMNGENIDTRKCMLSMVNLPYQHRSTEIKYHPIDFIDDYLFKTTITENKTINSEGALISESKMAVTDFIPVNENEQWDLKFTATTSARTRRIYGYDANQEPVSSLKSTSWTTVGQEYTLSATITSDIKYIRASYYIDDTDKSLTINGADIINVYGGYVDLVKGELVKNIVFIELDGSENWKIAGNTYAYVFGYPNCTFSSSSWKRHKSSHWENVKYGNANDIAINSNGAITIGVDFFDAVGLEFTASALKEYLAEQKANETPLQITSPLTTPIIHQLTPQQLQTFKNENNIWSNGDSVEIDYDLTETFDIQKAKRKIIMSQPHVESASNSPSSLQVIKFKTDMKAPLKQCIINFAPIQEGSGDPSPDNIRPIKGWNGITLKHTGINMLQCSSPSYYIDATNNGITSQSSRNADNEIIGIDFSGTTTSTNIFRNLNYNPNNGSAVTMPRGLIGLTGYSDQVYVIPMGNSNAPRTTDGRYWTGANTNSENGWNVWSVNSSETYNGLWVRTQVFPRESNVNVDTTVYPMMCLAEDVGCEFKPYKGESFDVDWTDEIGTVYGGYIDLVSGQLVITHYSPSATSWTVVKQNNGFICYKTETPDIISDTWYCNMINEYGNFNSSNMNKNIIQQTKVGTNIYLALDENADILNLQLVMPLATPIVHQLTPQQIITFKGQNNIWANTNKLTEIKYWNHKKSDSTGVIYEAENLTFDGTNYIDTGVYLFSEKNINRDFEVVIEDLYGNSGTGSITIVCAKYDSEAIGFLIRLVSNTGTTYNGTIFMKPNNHNNITIKRVNGVITIDGEVITNPKIKFTNAIHNHPLVLGCALQDDGTPMRYATGTIGHITVKWL